MTERMTATDPAAAHARGHVNDSAARVYDELFVPALFERWPAPILDTAAVRSGQRILDVACGTGVLAKAASARGAHAVGIDLNPGMLAVAREHEGIRWVEGPAESLPFEDQSFDAVVSQFGLMFFADPKAALREMRRVLRPGGRMVVAVWASLAKTPGYAAMAALVARLFGEDAAESLRAPYALGDGAALRALFADVGAAHIEERAGVARFPSLDRWVHVDIRGWTLADVIDDAGFEELLSAAQDELASFVQPDGSVEFAAPALIALHER